MLKKLQTKFILILMSFVSVILLSVFGIVCCSNYVHDKKDVERSLEMALRLKDKDFSISFGNSRNFNGNSFVIYTDSDYEYMITSRTVWNIYAEDAQSLIESVEHKEDVGYRKTDYT
jgi:two-component system, OmpR family, sensor histidine kinase CiaH